MWAVVLSADITLEFDSKDCETIEEDHQINTLALFVIDFFHHRKHILLIQCFRFRIKRSI